MIRLPRLVLAVLCMTVLAAAQVAQVTPATSTEPLALVNATVVNVRDGKIAANATIVLRDGRIASVGTGAAPAGVKAIDLKGKYVVPGLIDAHTHADNFAAFRRALESGVTTVRSAGVSNYADVGFNTLVKNGVVAGPNVITAGYHVRPQMAQEARCPRLSDSRSS
jgi:imidazolonepropionase-like amidohydrolase